MPFPERKRVVYKKNPLDRVVCQLRFPPILKIDAEVPANFQERIRKEFPIFSEAAELKLEFPSAVQGAVSPEMMEKLVQPAIRNYEFASDDGTWKVNLTRSFIALTTTKYTRWEEFKSKFELPLSSFIEIYSPDYFTRVGLRYIDLVKRSVLGLADVAWDDLLQPYVIGMLSTPEVGNSIQDFESKNEIKLEDGESTARIITKLFELPESGEICFIFDSDFFSQSKINVEQAIDKLDYFNLRSSRLIQWCITGRLHDAMEPENL